MKVCSAIAVSRTSDVRGEIRVKLLTKEQCVLVLVDYQDRLMPVIQHPKFRDVLKTIKSVPV